MKQGSNRRPRPRGNPNKPRTGGGRNSYDSNGPAGKVRGTAQQVLDKYQALGRDATTAGDRIGAESFFQFAEHYHRIVNADTVSNAPNQHQSQNQNQERPDRQNSPEPESVVEVTVVAGDDVPGDGDVKPADNPEAGKGNISEEIAEQPVVVEQADAEQPVSEEPPVEVKEEAPKAPRRRRSRAKVETPAPTDAVEA
jgi:hypothetical protein